MGPSSYFSTYYSNTVPSKLSQVCCLSKTPFLFLMGMLLNNSSKVLKGRGIDVFCDSMMCTDRTKVAVPAKLEVWSGVRSDSC